MPKMIRSFLGLDNPSSLRSHLIQGASGSFIIKVTSTALAMCTSIVLARLLGPAGLGTYAFALALAQFLVIPATLGLYELLVREVASYQVQKSWGLLRGLFRRSNQASLAMSLILSLCTIAITWILKGRLEVQLFTTVLLAMLLLPLVALTRIWTGILYGLRYVLIAQFPRFVLRPALFLLLLGGAYIWLGQVLSAPEAMGMQVFSSGFAFMCIVIFLCKRLPKEVKVASPEFKTKTWAKSAGPLLFAGSMQIINKEAAILMLGALLNAEAVGLYQVAQRAAELITFSLIAVNLTIGPTFSKLYTNGEMKRLQRVMTLSARAILVFSLPVALGLIVYAHRIVTFVFGAKFAPAARPLAILCVAEIVNAGMGSVGLLLNMTGFERDNAKGVAIAAVLIIILNALLVPIWGITGAAIATGISIVTWNLLLAIWAFRHIGIYCTAFGRLK